jgi:integrase
VGEGAARTREPKTFGDVAELLTSGELHRRYPDRVDAKSAERVRARAAVLCQTVGDVPLRRFTVETAERALAAVPRHLMRSTRRQYAQAIGRVLRLAVFPLRVIEHSPLPDRWMPSAGQRRAFSFLYPSEDEQLLRCSEIELSRRLLYGFLAREGLRVSEALRLTWDALDLELGVIRLDRNKTKRPRTWKLATDCLRALRYWGKVSRRGQGATVFHDTIKLTAAAACFRSDLLLAKVDRADLHAARTAERNPMRVHDLRATFITLALANGRTETWVMDRTGHTTSSMLNAYRRQARHAAELELGWLGPLDELLWPGQGRGSGGRNQPKKAESRTPSRTSDVAVTPEPSAFLATATGPGGAKNTTGPAEPAHPGHGGPIELALAEALRAATAAGEWAVVSELARELAERRRERTSPDVPSLELARAKRKRQR